jgi:hypothetical protein
MRKINNPCLNIVNDLEWTPTEPVSRQDAFQQWIATRPESVQRLAKEFPLDTKFYIRGTLYYVLGYTEDDRLIVSTINPFEDYDRAFESATHFCAEHAREGHPALLEIEPDEQ